MDPITVAGVASAVGGAVAPGMTALPLTPSLPGGPGNKHVKSICGGCRPEAVSPASAGRGLCPASAGRQEAVA